MRLFLTGYTVGVITGDAKKLTATYSLIIGHLFDTIVALTAKNF